VLFGFVIKPADTASWALEFSVLMLAPD